MNPIPFTADQAIEIFRTAADGAETAAERNVPEHCAVIMNLSEDPDSLIGLFAAEEEQDSSIYDTPESIRVLPQMLPQHLQVSAAVHF